MSAGKYFRDSDYNSKFKDVKEKGKDRSELKALNWGKVVIIPVKTKPRKNVL